MSSSVDAAISIEKLDEGNPMVNIKYLNLMLKVEKLEEAMLSFVGMEQKIKDHMSALEKLKTYSPRNADEFDITKVFKTKLRETQKSQQTDPTKHNKYRDFKQKVWNVHHSGESHPDQENEDLIVMGTESSTQTLICPLTKQTLVEPIRSTKCGHVYSKAAIMAHIKNTKKKGGGTGCPVAGCSHTVDISILERDIDVERQLKRRKVHEEEDEEEEGYTQL
jgi:SUMO ligase MMS21 Smc5/6 complex component